MEIIDPAAYNNARHLPKTTNPKAIPKLTDKEFDVLLKKMKNPAEAQKELAVTIKTFLDNRMQSEMETQGVLSDHTRRWVESYTAILGNIQKALYGDKSVNLHLHKVSHSQVAAKMRKVVQDVE